uniref:(northern house mosquito) hypothetical protein n=1 Tax=Culex pipiens TaxID=7175 RepID=A0A8D8C8U7_CULPI
MLTGLECNPQLEQHFLCNLIAKIKPFLSVWLLRLRKKLLDFIQLIVLSFRVLKSLWNWVFVCESECVFVQVRGNFKMCVFFLFLACFAEQNFLLELLSTCQLVIISI